MLRGIIFSAIPILSGALITASVLMIAFRTLWGREFSDTMVGLVGYASSLIGFFVAFLVWGFVSDWRAKATYARLAERQRQLEERAMVAKKVDAIFAYSRFVEDGESGVVEWPEIAYDPKPHAALTVQTLGLQS